MIISQSNQVVQKPFMTLYPNIKDVKTLDELDEVVKYDHGCFVWENNLRSKANFKQADCIVADVDNSRTDVPADWITLDMLIAMTKEYEVFIVPSKNHNIAKYVDKMIINEDGKKEKTSVEQAARPKYHLYFPLSTTITNLQEIETLYKKVIAKYPIFDGALKDAARYIDGNITNPNRAETHYHSGGMIDKYFDYKKFELSPMAKPENYIGIEQGTLGRHEVLLEKLGHLKGKGFTRYMIEQMAWEINKTYNPPIEEDRMKRIIDFATKEQDDDPSKDLKKMQDRYQLIVIGGQKFIIEGNDILEIMKYDTLRTLTAHKKYRIPGKDKERAVFDDWLESQETIRYSRLEFSPDIDKVDNMGFKIYNQWRGWSAAPSSQGSCQLFLDHIKNIICRGRSDEYEYIMNWLAHMVQYPTTKLRHQTALVIRGKRGTGKGTFGELLGYCLFDPYNFLLTSQKADLFGKFNAPLAGKVLVYGNEIEWPGDPESENLFKALITNPNLRLEKKFADAVDLKNCCHFIIDTNSDWAAPVGENERRFAVFTTSDMHIGNLKYFQDIEKEIKNGGAEKLLHTLLTRDISQVDWSDIPKNDSYIQQKELSMGIVEKFIEDQIQTLANGYDKQPGLDPTSIFSFKTKHYVCISPQDLHAMFHRYVLIYGTANDKNYYIRQKRFDRKFREILFAGQLFKGCKKMINGRDCYYFHPMQMFRAWKKYVQS